MPNNKVQSLQVVLSDHHTQQYKTDFVAVESPLEIRLTHDGSDFHTLAVTLCSPKDLEVLITGYLFTERIIQKPSDIIDIKQFDNELGHIAEVWLKPEIKFDHFLNKRFGLVHASCGICGKSGFDDVLLFNYPKIQQHHIDLDPAVILSLPEKIDQYQTAFTQTGGIHASALFSTTGELICLKEDIGRHNALDKLIGDSLINNRLPLSDYLLLLSGRISFELTHKALISGVSTLVAIGAPSSLGVELANNNDMTMIGFVKQNHFNIYSNSHRIKSNH